MTDKKARAHHQAVARRACSAERRISNLKLLGRLADEVLRPAAADRVIELIGRRTLIARYSPLAV